MDRIVIAICALAFVQLHVVSSQTCQQALSDFNSDLTCATSIDPPTVCMGVCRTLYDNVISSCDNTTAATNISLIAQLCSPCGMAQSALLSDTTCANATDAATICVGTCQTLYNDVISSCDNATAARYATLVDTICGSCGMALSALSTDATCGNATDASTVCMGTCQTLYNNIISSCDNATASGFAIRNGTLCSPCGIALASNTICTNATDPSTVCMGICRTVYDDIISNCNESTSATFSSLISTLCSGGTNTEDRCVITGNAINDVCLILLRLGDNSTCTGTCGNQLATAAAACTNTSDRDIQGAVQAYNDLCGFEAQCTVATNEFDALSSCDAALRTSNTETLCSVTCRSSLEDVLNSCPTFNVITRDALNQACGGSGSEVLQASGIITLLLVAICAFTF